MALRDLALSAHFIGLILWIGGAVTAATVAASAARAPEEGRRIALVAARRAVLYWATPGMLLAWAGGLTVLVPDFGVLYARAGWMHAKLALLVVLTALTGVFTGRLRRAAEGRRAASGGLFNGLGVALVIGATLVVLLAKLRPF